MYAGTYLLLGFRVHQLDQCLFMLYNPDGNLVGLVGVYVDDFVVAGDETDDCWNETLQKLRNLYTWGSWSTGQFTL